MLCLSIIFASFFQSPQQARAEGAPGTGCVVLAGVTGDSAGFNTLVGRVASYVRNTDTTLIGSLTYLDRLNLMVRAWGDPNCTTLQGGPQMGALLDGLAWYFEMTRDWTVSKDRVEAIKQRFPNTPLSAIAEAAYWYNYAWLVRGNGYSSTVTKDAYVLYTQRLEHAEAILWNSKSYADSSPVWYQLLIETESSLGRSDAVIEKIFLEGATKFKWYYQLVTTRANFLLPRWGGSYQKLEDLADWGAKNSKAYYGEGVYAKIYWYIGDHLDEGETLFHSTRARWPRMKQGFEDMLVRFPNSGVLLNTFGAFACAAEDGPTFVRLRKQIGDDVRDEAWPRAHTLWQCESKFGVAHQ